MKKKIFACLVTLFFLLSITVLANAVIIDFTGGTAYQADGTVLGTTNNSLLFNGSVAYYIEDGIKYEFKNASGLTNSGIIGDYYSINGVFYGNDVIHAHWSSSLTSMVISKLDGSTFDLNYIDLTSNTIIGGGQENGT